MQGSQSITRHRWFPAVVTVWFAALFGLSTLALRGSLLEELVLSFHIQTIIPAAAPPLGMTAKTLVALTMALAGASLGAIVSRVLARVRRDAGTQAARRAEQAAERAMEQAAQIRAAREEAAVASSAADTLDDTTGTPPAAKPARSLAQRLRGRDAHPDAPARRPILAHEELGQEGLDELGLDEWGADEHDQPFIRTPTSPLRPADSLPAESFPSVLAARDSDSAEAIVPENASWLAPLRRPADSEADLPPARPSEVVIDAPTDWQPAPLASPLFAAALSQSEKAQGEKSEAGSEPAAQSQAQPLRENNQSLGEDKAPAEARAQTETVSQANIFARAADAHDRLSDTPLDGLSHLELIERLALAMQRRRERDAERRAEAEASGEEQDAPRFPITGETERARAVAELRVLRGGQADAAPQAAPAATPVPGLVTLGRGGAAQALPSLPAPADETDQDLMGASLHAALASLRRLK